MASDFHVSEEELYELAMKLDVAAKPLSAEQQARIDELSKDLLPGEDWLHYDVDRLFPPPPAPPSEMMEQVVQPVSKARGPKTRPGSRSAAKRQNGKTVPAAGEPRVRVPKKAPGPATVQMRTKKAFVAGTGKQTQAVRERRVRKRQLRRGVMVVVALLAMGGMAVAWAYVDKGDDVKPTVPAGEATAPTAAAIAPTAVVTAMTTVSPVAVPTATAVVTVRPVEAASVPSATLNIRPAMPMKLQPKPSLVSPPIASTATAEPTVAPAPTAEPPPPTAVEKVTPPPTPTATSDREWSL